MTSKRFLGVAILTGLLFAALWSGCAEERDAIDRVQPNVIKKSMLDGTWYFHQKVVDVPGGMLQGFFIPSVVGWYSEPERVSFDIQERFLYVRRVNELVEEAETYSHEWDDDFASEAILAAYSVTSHFDIQRDYNSVTGESYNVVSENSFDRPWYEREYMRVDWSRNLAPGYNFDVNFVPTNPIDFYVQTDCTPDREFAPDPADRCIPDDKAPFFDIVWNGDGSGLKQGYFDVVNAFTTLPETEYLEGYGEIPSCWLYGNDAEECVSTMYYVRNSFWKYEQNEKDFEPMPYSGAISDQFGFFFNDKLVYDPQDSVIETSRKYYINRHNLWEQSHSWNDDQGIDWSWSKDDLFNPQNRRLCHTTADCCAAYDPDDPTSEALDNCKSICDVYTDLRPEDRDQYEEKFGCSFHVTPQNLTEECQGTHYCTIPYDERRVRPMVYYINPEWPEDLVRNPWEPKYVPPTADNPGVWSYDTDHTPDNASLTAWAYAMADEEEGTTRSCIEQVGDRWNAPFVRTINILKMKAADKYNSDIHANVPYIDDDMTRKEGATDFPAIGVVAKDANGVPTGNRGFDENWYDPERPPFAMCRFSPVLGPDNDPDNVEPDICWERIQDLSHCVFNPDNPGINPKTGELWREASSWPICSKREATPRLGDVRYSFAYWVDKWYDGFRLLGLGPGHPDPVTGETLSGVGHIYMHNDMAARRIVDTTMLLTGDLNPREYIDGYNLIGWRNKYTGSGTNPSANTFQGYDLSQLMTTAEGISANMRQFNRFELDLENIQHGSGGDGLPVHSSSLQELSDVDASHFQTLPFTLDDLMQAAATSYTKTPDLHDDDAMMKSIASSPEGQAIEAAMLNEANATTMLAGAGLDPIASDWENDEDVRDQILMTRRNPFNLASARHRLREWLESDKVMDFAENLDDVNYSLAYEVQRLRGQGKLPTSSGMEFRNALWRLARKKLIRAVVMHELGHSLGLRHNFAGSQGFMNYFEPYWEIRENGCADVTTDYLAPQLGDPEEVVTEDPWDDENGCGNGATGGRIGVRYVSWEDGGDPLSQYEIFKKLYHYSYTSVMDYSSSYHIDEAGVGRYEWAVMLYGYGHHFEVYKDYPKQAGTNEPAWWTVREAYRPGFATEDSPDACTIIDDHDGSSSFTQGQVQPGARVINRMTGEKTTVEAVDAYQLTLADPCFSAPMQEGDKYAVEGAPVGFDTYQIAGYDLEQVYNDYVGFGGSPLVLFYAYFFAPNYTEFYRNWVNNETGLPDRGFNIQDNRDVRDIRMFDWRVRSQGNSYEPGYRPVASKDVDPVLRVPYAYCTDNQADISNDCRRRDYGADDWERMHYLVADWDQWYITRSFIRNRVGFMPDDYPSSYYERLYRFPKNFNDIYTLYVELFSSIYDERQVDALMTDPYNSWGGYTMALHDGFNMLMRAIAAPEAITGFSATPRPETGEWGLDGDPVLGMGTAGIDIAQGGRVLETRYGNSSYDNNCGNSFWRCLWNVGWYYDKVMAINGLTESGTYFVGRDTAHDVRLYRISFFDTFNWQVKKYFSALMGEKWDEWAPMTVYSTFWNTFPYLFQANPVLPESAGVNPNLWWRDWANPVNDITNPAIFQNDPTISANLAVVEGLLTDDEQDDYRFLAIDPTVGFTTQVYAMVLAMARFQHNYDLSFYNTSRMWVRSGNEVSVPGHDEEDYVRYYDAENKLTYSALKEYGVNQLFHPYTTSEETGTGVAASMIEFANKMKARSSECDPIDDPFTPEVESETPDWDYDDCCDNPYEPTTADTADDCPAEFGDPAGMDEQELLQASADFQMARAAVDEYLKRYKGLLDFQVRLTNVYDTYMGFVGDEYDPGNTPEE